MTDVVEINDLESLRSYHLAWTALHAETRHASFFQTQEWLENYWKYCGEGQRLRVLIVRADGRPIGIVPLVEHDEPSRLGTVRVLTYPLEDWGAWYGPIGAQQTATLALAMRYLASQPRTWDVFVPRWTAHGTSDRGRTEQAMRLAGLTPTVETDAVTSVVELEKFAGWESYLDSRSTKTRHELRRKRRRLQSEHKVEFVRWRPDSLRHGDGDARWDLYAKCVSISQKSWQSLSKTGNTLCNESVGELLADAHGLAARLGMVDVSLLMVDDEPAAFYYAYHCRGEVFGLRTGYNPAVASGAGAVLLGMVIEDSFARGDVSFDLGAGPEAYKRRLRTSLRTSSRLTHIAPAAWRPRALRLAKRWAPRVGQAS